MEELIKVISEYESDTFNVLLTPQDAHDIAEALIARVARVLNDGGVLYLDGVLLSDLYIDIQERVEDR